MNLHGCWNMERRQHSRERKHFLPTLSSKMANLAVCFRCDEHVCLCLEFWRGRYPNIKRGLETRRRKNRYNTRKQYMRVHIHHEHNTKDITQWNVGWTDNAHYALDQLIIHLEISHPTYASGPAIDWLHPETNLHQCTKENYIFTPLASLTGAFSWDLQCTP